ncbi:MAG: amino acid ABC transporter ATP-binding/permease protein, partial [Pseudomonadota bacterium]
MAASERHVHQLEALRSRTIEQLQGLAELEAYSGLDDHRRKLDAIEQQLQQDQRQLGHFAALGNALQAWLVSAATLMTLWLAALAWQAGSISGAIMVMLPMAVLAMNEALGALPAAFTWLGATKGAAARLNQLDAKRVTYSAGTTAPPQEAKTLSLDAVSVVYPGALQPALDTLSFALAPGERLAITGNSGSGKSTLAALISRQLAPSQGHIMLGGIHLADWPEHELRQRVAVLTQHSELFDDSLAANLRVAYPEADDDLLWQALENVDLADWAKSLPKGLRTRVGEGGRQLSGGQARRVALARLYLRDPDLVLLDEPFAGVDSATAQRLAARLDTWLQQRSVIYLVHQRQRPSSRQGERYLPGVSRQLALASH